MLDFDQNTLKAVWQLVPAPAKAFALAAAGTLFGAWLTSRAQTKKPIVTELQGLHAAQSLCITIMNKSMALKRQQVLPMKQRYDDTTASYEAAMADPRPEPLPIDFDLQTVSEMNFRTDALEKVLFEKCLMSAQGIAAVITLSDAAEALRISIDQRNALIKDFKSNAPKDTPGRLALYLGLYNNGEVDERFRHNIEALAKQVDDCIFFAMHLEDLVRTRERSVRKKNWQFRLRGDRLERPKWILPDGKALLPDAATYEPWTRGFIKSATRFQRAKKTLSRRWIYGSGPYPDED